MKIWFKHIYWIKHQARALQCLFHLYNHSHKYATTFESQINTFMYCVININIDEAIIYAISISVLD